MMSSPGLKGVTRGAPSAKFTRYQSVRLSQMPSWARAEVVICRSGPKAKVLALRLTITVLGEEWGPFWRLKGNISRSWVGRRSESPLIL